MSIDALTISSLSPATFTHRKLVFFRVKGKRRKKKLKNNDEGKKMIISLQFPANWKFPVLLFALSWGEKRKSGKEGKCFQAIKYPSNRIWMLLCADDFEWCWNKEVKLLRKKHSIELWGKSAIKIFRPTRHPADFPFPFYRRFLAPRQRKKSSFKSPKKLKNPLNQRKEKLLLLLSTLNISLGFCPPFAIFQRSSNGNLIFSPILIMIEGIFFLLHSLFNFIIRFASVFLALRNENQYVYAPKVKHKKMCFSKEKLRR